MLQFRAKVYRRGKFSLIPNACNRRIMSWRWCEIMSWKRSVCLQFFLSKRVGTIQWSRDRVAQPSQLERAYSPLWGCAGDRVKMVVKVHCGTVLGDAFSTWRQFCPQNSPTMHFDNHLDPVSRATSKWRIYEKKLLTLWPNQQHSGVLWLSKTSPVHALIDSPWTSWSGLPSQSV